MSKYIDIVFDGPPGPTCGRFVEVEDEFGKSINFGEWVERPDGWNVLRIPDSEELLAACQLALSEEGRQGDGSMWPHTVDTIREAIKNATSCQGTSCPRHAATHEDMERRCVEAESRLAKLLTIAKELVPICHQDLRGGWGGQLSDLDDAIEFAETPY